jgi:low temperature requirement protein LtrA
MDPVWQRKTRLISASTLHLVHRHDDASQKYDGTHSGRELERVESEHFGDQKSAIDDGDDKKKHLYNSILEAILLRKTPLTSDDLRSLFDLQHQLGISNEERDKMLQEKGLPPKYFSEFEKESPEVAEHLKWESRKVKYIETGAESEGFAITTRLRQYLDGDVLYREKEEARAAWSELFYDLVFVGVLSTLAHQLENSWSIFIFPIFFSIEGSWYYFTLYFNFFRPKDIIHKVLFLLQMLSIIGIVVNIHLVMSIDTKEKHLDEERNCLLYYSLFTLISKTLIMIQFGWSALMYDHRSPHKSLLPFIFLTQYLPFWILQILPYILSMAVFDQRNLNAIFILWTVGFCVESLSGYIFLLFRMALHRYDPHPNVFPTINIEHMSERNGLWVILVLGETVVSARFDDECEDQHWQYIVAFLIIVIAFFFEWIYFDSENSIRTHALARSFIFAGLWRYSHMLFTLSLVVLSAGLAGLLNAGSGKFATEDGHSLGVHEQTAKIETSQWYASEGAASALFFSVLIHCAHAGQHAGHIIPRILRLGFRVVVGIYLIFLPYIDVDDRAMFTVATIAGGLLLIVIVENMKGVSLKKRKWLTRDKSRLGEE